MNDWKEYTLCDVIEKFIDYRGKTPEKVSHGIPLITAKIIKNGSILEPNEFIRVEDYDSWMTRGLPEINDVLITTEAPLGEVAIIKNTNVALAQRVILLRGNKTFIFNPFLYYSLQSKLMQYRLKSRSSGSTVQGIKASELKQLKIPLPPLKEQQKIAAILSSLDAKIDNLRRQNETLEEIAQTLFKHWFIDFEFPPSPPAPLPQGEGCLIRRGDGYKSNGGVMVASELGEIPEGWRVGKLGDVCKNIRLNIKETDLIPNTPYIGLEHIPRKSIALDNWGTSEDLSSNKFYFKKGQILFGKLRPYFHKVGVAFISGVCSTDILVLDAKKDIYFSFVLMTVSSSIFIKYVTSASEGTRMPRTNWNYMSNFSLAIPNEKILIRFDDLIKNFIGKIENNINQIQTLTKTRDELLPKLMRGEIRIREEVK